MTNSSSLDHLFAAAWQAQTSGRFEEAIGIYRQMLQQGDNASVWLGIGQCHLECKDTAAALAAFRRASAILPDSGAIKHMVAMLEGGAAPERAPDDYVLWVFDGHADDFDARLAGLKYCAPEMIYGLIESVWPREPTRRILDLGCGTGLNAKLFRQYAATLDGIDLAPRMLSHAVRRGYDRLYKGEIHAFLEQTPTRYNILLSTDVFIYIGHLEKTFALCRRVLEAAGELLCTIELGDDTGGPVQLMPTGRFRQSDDYIRKCAENNGFFVAAWSDSPLRIENGIPEPGRAYRLIMKE